MTGTSVSILSSFNRQDTMPVHIKAEKKDIAPFVLMPGDPDRATYIAEKYLTDVRCYTDYRKMYGYTGLYEGMPVSVQTTGMGTPSVAIITEELIMLGAKVLMRVGTCGALQPEMKLGDVIISSAAWGSRDIVKEITGSELYSPVPDSKLMIDCYEANREISPGKFHLGPIGTVNLFYSDPVAFNAPLAELGCCALEMESAAIFSIAAKKNVAAASMFTVSDLIQDPKNMVRASDQVILEGVDRMIKASLKVFGQRKG